MSVSPLITFRGVTKTRAEWARELGLHPNTLAFRLKAGWPIKDALFKKSLRSDAPVKSYPEHASWRSMRDRCLNPTHHAYARYGGAGVTICPRWSSFHNFYEDMGPRPFSSATLERIDNNKGYSVCNCYWASRKAQNRNKKGVKLSHAAATQIRHAYSQGATQLTVARQFGISRPNVSLVVNNKIWT